MAIAFLAIVIIGGLGSVPGAVFGAIVVYGLQQFFLLGANQFGWFADAQFGGLNAVVLSAFVYGAAVVLVVLFEPGGAAAIGRRLDAPPAPPQSPAKGPMMIRRRDPGRLAADGRRPGQHPRPRGLREHGRRSVEPADRGPAG